MSVLSTPFYVMQFLDGRTFEDQTLPGMTPTDRRAIYGEMVATIAKLHRLDYGRLGLGDFGRPGNYVARQIARWTKGYRESETMRIPAMDALIDWLPRHVPALETTRLVHGDFRLDNLILAPDGPRIIGVIDWELATLGNPIADFAYHCMSWHIPPDIWRGIKGHDLAALGIPAEADYVGLYAQALGFDVLPDWNFYLSYNFFRIAAILQGIAKRAEVGSATADNAIETGRKAAPLAEIGMRLAGIA
jgi:acyl-CoA dehydrogenase